MVNTRVSRTLQKKMKEQRVCRQMFDKTRIYFLEHKKEKEKSNNNKIMFQNFINLTPPNGRHQVEFVKHNKNNIK